MDNRIRVDSQEIIDVLTEDRSFQKDPIKLFELLGIPGPDLQEFRNGFAALEPVDQIMRQIMVTYYSFKSKNATIVSIISALELLNTRSSLDALNKLPAETDVRSREVINILTDDSELCRRLPGFCENLGFQNDDIYEIERQFGPLDPIENIPREMMQIWISRAGQQRASPKNLLKVLHDLRLKDCHKLLQQHFNDNPDDDVESEDVLNILKEDKLFLRKWLSICKKLGSFSNSEIFQLERKFISKEECFEERVRKLLQCWISRNGKSVANLGTLAEHLKSAGLVECYKKVSAKLDEAKQKHPELKVVGDQILIKENETGRSYESVFGPFLNKKIQKVELSDPYIHNSYQIENCKEFVYLVQKNCSLKEFVLNTTKSKKRNEIESQENELSDLKADMAELGVNLTVNYQKFHPRSLVLDTGMKFHLDIGLDYFHYYERHEEERNIMDKRKCKASEISIVKV